MSRVSIYYSSRLMSEIEGDARTIWRAAVTSVKANARASKNPNMHGPTFVGWQRTANRDCFAAGEWRAVTSIGAKRCNRCQPAFSRVP